ncbi:choline ABC transporter ATP-binding protein [Sneathiella aquimaris]|uniref:choline ABC transporter ATP-binding protein n=1 Tax=Sneathiella aquimaris TaxID=2599305 RepID=UPI00146F65AD|nr:choline ABC transporter ATP-binding protein [Sneathiella aquimaris]
MDIAVQFDNVSVIFGLDTGPALDLANAGKEREEIEQQTGNVLGVSDCTLSVERGEIVVLMGLSGSGKSTLLRTVNGLNPITNGNVQVHNGDELIDIGCADKQHLQHLRRDIVSMVFQNFALLPWRTVAENVGLGLELSGLSKKERAAKVDHQLELVGLSDWKDRKITELSGGMRQRVGLARAFVTEAPILLMDEPFSALDPLIRAHLQDELLDLQQRSKRTILFVSHDLDEAMKIGNKIAIMKGGRIVQFGTPQEIVLKPADDYVKDFVAHMNPMNVLRAKDVMRPLTSGLKAGDGAAVSVDTPLQVLVSHMEGELETIQVVEGQQAVGSISPQDVFKALAR